MSRLYLVVVAALLVACQHAAANRGGPADQVLAQYRLVLEDTLAQQKDEGRTKLMETVYRVTRAELLPHRPLLHQHAIYLLGLLERRPLPNTAAYRSLLSNETRAEMNMLFDRKVIETVLTTPSLQDNEMWAVVVSYWNPIKIAVAIPPVLEARAYGAVELGKRGLVHSFAPLSMYRTSDDWRSPTLVLEGGHELFVIQTTYDEQLMIYVPVQVDWYAKQAEAAQK